MMFQAPVALALEPLRATSPDLRILNGRCSNSPTITTLLDMREGGGVDDSDLWPSISSPSPQKTTARTLTQDIHWPWLVESFMSLCGPGG